MDNFDSSFIKWSNDPKRHENNSQIEDVLDAIEDAIMPIIVKVTIPKEGDNYVYAIGWCVEYRNKSVSIIICFNPVLGEKLNMENLENMKLALQTYKGNSLNYLNPSIILNTNEDTYEVIKNDLRNLYGTQTNALCAEKQVFAYAKHINHNVTNLRCGQVHPSNYYGKVGKNKPCESCLTLINIENKDCILGSYQGRAPELRTASWHYFRERPNTPGRGFKE